MNTKLRVVMGQFNLLVGDVPGNVEKVLAATARARDEFKAQLVVFPELTLTGYPPEDLLFHSALRHEVEAGVARVRDAARGIHVLIGYPLYENGHIYNVSGVFGDGKLKAQYRKQELPNYSVFDEKRYFTPGDAACLFEIDGIPIGLNICEDIWHAGPACQAAAAGAKLVIVTNASPFEHGKQQQREQELRRRVGDAGVPFMYMNLVGGQDELVFDGGSLVMNAAGQVTMRAPNFEEGLFPADFSFDGEQIVPVAGPVHTDASIEESVYRAIILGVRDYVSKNHFKGAVIGLSGGVDSALTLAIAVDALGAENVTAVMMPSRYTSELSLKEARAQAELLGVEYHTISIEPAFRAFVESLQETLHGDTAGVTEQNIQARCRGVLLMAVSNKSGKLVLNTSNKSESAVGYATLYGDMTGGFAPIRDCVKTLVYGLCRYRNTLSPAIPEAVIERVPSAELAANQKDSDALPPYDVLDPILEAYVVDDRTVAEIVAMGFDEAIVKRVVKMVQGAEYKRRQAPPGVRVSRRSFGRDRRYPITSGYHKH